MTTGRIPPVEGGIQPTIFDAKADLLTATAADVPARLAVGSNGDTLVADSTTTTGLRWQADWNTGKNKIINGDFGIWQRGTSFTATGYTADRWYFVRNSTMTLSRQTFTPGTAPVSGYEGTFFLRMNRTATSASDYLVQKIEDVTTFAGQTVTYSFWAKANTNVTLTQSYYEQNFGSGGSATVAGGSTSYSLTSSWQRFSATFTLPSISGKTIGTSSSLDIAFEIGSAMGTSVTVDFWGVQLEAGSVATPFTTATGTIQGELAACQRYYEKSYDVATAPGTNTSTGMVYTTAGSDSGNSAGYLIAFKVTKRGIPTMTFYEEGGTVGNWKYSRSGVGSTAATANAGYNGQNYVLGYVNSGTTWAVVNVQGHWVASAEL